MSSSRPSLSVGSRKSRHFKTCLLYTSSTFLYEYTLSLLEVNGVVPIVALPDLYQEEAPLTQYGIPRVLTHYEKQWLGRGKVIKYIRFALPMREQWLEPESEPEHDDYTSSVSYTHLICASVVLKQNV